MDQELIDKLFSKSELWYKLYMLAIANPKDLIPSDWTEEPVRFIKNEVDRLMESIDENLIDLYKLELLLENYQEPAKE